MGTAVVAAGAERLFGVGDLLEGLSCSAGSLDACRVRLRAADDEEVVHERLAVSGSIAVRNELLFLVFRVDQRQVGVTGLGVTDGNTGTRRSHFDFPARLRFKGREKVRQKAGVVDGCGGRKADRALRGSGGGFRSGGGFV